jgi:lipoyl-dependent peroxiredoxin
MAMADRTANTVWEGGLAHGNGNLSLKSGATGDLPVTWASRTERSDGKTSPEELIAAAHAACFSMALSAGLEKAGKPAARIQTDAACTLEMVNGTPTITKMELKVRGTVPGLDQAGFQKAAEEAKSGCPVSRALKGIAQISLAAKLE